MIDTRIFDSRGYPIEYIGMELSNSTNLSISEHDFMAVEYGRKRGFEYDIEENEVAALVSDAIVGSVGTTVYADAIRWTYLGEKTTEEAAQQ